MSKPLIITHVTLTSLVTLGSVVLLGSHAIAGEPLAWVRIILAVSLAGGMLQASFAARSRGETSTADIVLKWATAATAILAITIISAEISPR